MGEKGVLAIEFLKTRGWEPRDRQDDELVDFGALIRWAGRYGLLEPEDARAQLEQARTLATDHIMKQCNHLRTDIYHLFRDVAAGRIARAGPLGRLGRIAAAGASRQRLMCTAAGWSREWTMRSRADMRFVLWGLASSAVELLGDDATRDRLRQCASRDCGWFFLDASRNQSRRWCSMKDCGNVEKSRRFRRQRAG